MSRDQKPGRTSKLAVTPRALGSAGAPATETTGGGSAVSKPPVALLAGLFVGASLAGGVGFALSDWIMQ